MEQYTSNLAKILIPFFTTNYQAIMVMCSALVSELLSNYQTGNVRDNKDRTKYGFLSYIFSYAVKIIISTIIFLVALLLASALIILMKCIYQGWNHITDLPVTFFTLLSINIGELWLMFIFVPIFSLVARALFKNQVKGRVFAILILLIVMVVGPFLTEYRSSGSGLQEIIMEGCQRIPFPYITRLYEPTSFYSKYRNGYGDFPYEETGNSGNNEVTKPDTVDTSDFDSLIENAYYCYLYGYKSEAQYYLELAYAIYEKDPGAIEISYNLAIMWYCKGRYEENAVFYSNAGKVFVQLDQYDNAILSYWYSYTTENSHETADTIIQVFADSSEEALDHRIEKVEEILLIMQGSYPDSIPVLQKLTDLFPDSMPIQIVNVLRHIQENNISEKDMQTVERFLSKDRYVSCPKLLITRAYLKMLYSNAIDMRSTYELYVNHPEYFEPEDKIHLAWISYKGGNYSSAYNLMVAGSMSFYYEKGDSSDSNKNTELLFDVNDTAINAAIPLGMELYLQDSDSYAKINARRLRKSYSSVSEELNPWYNEDARLRFSIISLLLSDKLGQSRNGKEISKKAVRLFSKDTFINKILNAKVDYENKKYTKCCEQCEKLLETESLTVSERNQVLFLTADAYIARAKRAKKESKKTEFYGKAADAMIVVRNSAEPDYLESLKRLKTIYSEMGGDNLKEAKKINSILSIYEN